MILYSLCIAAFFITLLSAVMTCINLFYFVRPKTASAAAKNDDADRPLFSVCIPARNEEANIADCVRSLLASSGVRIEVLVYDDQSTDSTGRIVAGLSHDDPRVRSVPTLPLPAGWNGKQHACWRMAQSAKGEWLVFTDADVRFEPRCLVAALDQSALRGAALISTFPRQVIGSFGEAVIIPMIFFILLSYLPFARMRNSNSPAASAGCGQFLFVRKDAYAASGGHEAFKDSMHDGIMLPRAVRRAGFHTDLVDGTALLRCRMYKGFGATWKGFAKNAYEGLGSVGLLVFITVMHMVGHVLPFLVVAALILEALGLLSWPSIEPGFLWRPGVWAAAAVVLALALRTVVSVRMQHPVWVVPLHPVSVLLMTVVQWYSLYLHITGKRTWKGRVSGSAVPDAAA